jgi:hypothetical protein
MASGSLHQPERMAGLIKRMVQHETSRSRGCICGAWWPRSKVEGSLIVRLSCGNIGMTYPALNRTGGLHMKTSRKLIVLAMAATAAFTVSAPAVMAAPAFAQTCGQPGSRFTVAITGIHIKASPNGANLYTIAQGRTFYTTNSSTNRRGWLCASNSLFNHTIWDYGENAAFPSQQGWVGVNYMTYIGIDHG